MFLAAIFNRVEFIASNQLRRLRVFPRFAGQVVRATVRLLVVCYIPSYLAGLSPLSLHSVGLRGVLIDDDVPVNTD